MRRAFITILLSASFAAFAQQARPTIDAQDYGLPLKASEQAHLARHRSQANLFIEVHAVAFDERAVEQEKISVTVILPKQGAVTFFREPVSDYRVWYGKPKTGSGSLLIAFTDKGLHGQISYNNTYYNLVRAEKDEKAFLLTRSNTRHLVEKVQE